MIGKFFAAVGLQPPLPLFKAVLRLSLIITAIATIIGIVISVGIKNDSMSAKFLSIYPRYALAMDGLHTLKDMKYEVMDSSPNAAPSTTIPVGVLSIDDPSWQVLLDFVQSETAYKKSERSEAEPPQFPVQLPTNQPPTQTSSSSVTTASPTPAVTMAAPAPTPMVTSESSRSAPQQVLKPLPPIDFDRIKTITSIKTPTVSAGSKALTPPYHLIVLWPGNIPRRVYEFLSFEEFRLDLRHMMLDEIEEIGLWLGGVAAIATILLNAFLAFVVSSERKQLAAQSMVGSTDAALTP